MGAPGALGTGGGPSTQGMTGRLGLTLHYSYCFLGGGEGALEEPAVWHHSPATETKALCSAMPPLVTMRSVYTPSSSLYRLGIVSLVNPLPVSIFTHLESKRRTSGE